MLYVHRDQCGFIPGFSYFIKFLLTLKKKKSHNTFCPPQYYALNYFIVRSKKTVSFSLLMTDRLLKRYKTP